MLRLQSYLAPSIPYGFFRAVAEHLERSLGVSVELTFETQTSGPVEGQPDPLSRGEIDLAFLCAPTYAWLARENVARLVAAPIPSDPRAEGAPVYFSDVVVARSSTATCIDDLTAARWALNDAESLSGYRCVVDAIGAPASSIVSGSHLASLDLVDRGLADAAAIDSNVLRLHPLSDRLKVVGSFGPHPIQPIVARTSLDPAIVERARTALIALGTNAPDLLTPFGFIGFAAVNHDHYARTSGVRHRRDATSALLGLSAEKAAR